MANHQGRAHSKYSASGSERRFACLASVDLEELSPPSQDSPWSLQGTEAHEVLESLFKIFTLKSFTDLRDKVAASKDPMIVNGLKMVRYVLAVQKEYEGSELLIEQKIYNEDLSPEMFGTADACLVQVFGTLHVFDYKYGMSPVDPKENTQLIQYALGLCHKYDWNFSRAVLHIVQPRIAGGTKKAWTISMDRLRAYHKLFKENISQIEKGGHKPTPGAHCHWCRAKNTCPAKQGIREEKIANEFKNNPFKERLPNEEKEHKESQAKSGKEKTSQKAKGNYPKGFWPESFEDEGQTKIESSVRYAHGVSGGRVYSRPV